MASGAAPVTTPEQLEAALAKVLPRGLARELLLTAVTNPAQWPLTPEAIEQYLVFLEAAGMQR